MMPGECNGGQMMAALTGRRDRGGAAAFAVLWAGINVLGMVVAGRLPAR